MPRVRHPDKRLISLWVYQQIVERVDGAAAERGIDRTRLVLEALADHLGFSLDEKGNAVEPARERLEVRAVENRKRASGKRSSRRSASEPPSGSPAGESSEAGRAVGKSAGQE